MEIKGLLALTSVTALLLASAAAAQDVRSKPITIGVLSDMAGNYSDDVGPGSLLAVQMAVEDLGGKAGNLPINVISADMQLKVDLATSISRKWIDEDGVDVIMSVPSSAASLAVSDIVKEKDKILVTDGGSSELTGAHCTPNTVQWAFSNYSVSTAVTNALMDQGAKSWFYITSDYAFGIDIAGLSKNVVKARNGEIVSEVLQPLGVVDQSSAILQATSSGADVIGLANGGADTQNAVKQLAEFGVKPGGDQKVTIFSVSARSVASMGLEQTQGVFAAIPFYYDLNDKTRAWSMRFMERSGGKPPTHQQAAAYAFVLNYGRVMAAHPTLSGSEALKWMRSEPTDDPLFGKGELRVDGSHIHPLYLFQVKSPSETTGPNDVFKLVDTIAPDQAFIPLSESKCPLAKQ